MVKLAASGVSFAILGACAGTPGTQPHEMSAARHEAMAEQAERGAALHQAQYDAGASETTAHCGRTNFTVATGVATPACWTSTRNPTAEHMEQASELRRIAAEHRTASEALRDAEARACVGVSDEDRDESPFAHREDIASAEALYASVSSGKGQYSRLQGATITFRAVPGMTAQWLQRIVDCHLARNAALGHDVPEMPYCPLVPRGVTATVTPVSAGFAVAVTSDDVDTATEVFRRARTLVTP
jgi:hypothetical protein